MLKLTLRQEFQSRRLKSTAIELANSSNTGATQISASDFLEITYPRWQDHSPGQPIRTDH